MLIAAVLACAAPLAFAQSRHCFVFQRGSELMLACDGRVQHVANLPGAANTYAIGPNNTLAAVDRSRVYLISLPSGRAQILNVNDVTAVQATCGTLVGVRSSAPPLDLLTGAVMNIAPYREFACSSDRRHILGFAQWRQLRQGPQAARPIASNAGAFDVSPSGNTFAFSQVVGMGMQQVCVMAGWNSGCFEANPLGRISVDDDGNLLFVDSQPNAAASSNCGSLMSTPPDGQSPAPPPSATCTGIWMWRPELSAVQFQQSGSNPQWLSDTEATALQAWPRRPHVKFQFRRNAAYQPH